MNTKNINSLLGLDDSKKSLDSHGFTLHEQKQHLEPYEIQQMKQEEEVSLLSDTLPKAR